MKQVKISGFLSDGGKIIRYISELGNKSREYSSLRELKEYYGLTDLKRTEEKEWAISGRGTKYDWFVYTAMMPEESELAATHEPVNGKDMKLGGTLYIEGKPYNVSYDGKEIFYNLSWHKIEEKEDGSKYIKWQKKGKTQYIIEIDPPASEPKGRFTKAEHPTPTIGEGGFSVKEIPVILGGMGFFEINPGLIQVPFWSSNKEEHRNNKFAWYDDKDVEKASSTANKIVKAVNNFDAMYNLLSRIVGSMSLEKVERFDLNDEAKAILNRINNAQS